MIQPALNSVEIIFQDQSAVTISDLKTGAVAEASFAYLGPSTVSQLQGNPCIAVQALPTVYGSTSGSWWIYLDQNQFPFTNLSVREAIAHAINYTQIIQQAFGGYASQWVGPVPPSYPYYNPQGLSPYAYNLPLARQEIANSPCANGACKSLDFKYAYINTGTDWSDTAQFLAADLAQINLTITPVAISLDQLYQEQTIDPTTGVCTTLESTNGGPFYMGQEFYTSDYISPDDWTQNDAISYGSANMCMSQFANATVDNLTLAAAASSNATFLNSSYSTMTSIMYNNYTDIWLVVPTSFAVYSTYLHGFLENPMASAEPYSLLFNTQSVS
jgi:peptide/nickel transport system substrate-binding protein